MLKSLQQLGEKYESDKAVKHPDHGDAHNFCPFYDYHLSSMRFDKLKILEIGIFDGASLRMWDEYFEKSQIFGIDILMHPKARLINEGKICSFKMDQGNIQDLLNFKKQYGPFDIVIDDGSHFTHHQWISWLIFSDSPVFIWEDLHTSRMPQYITSKNEQNETPLDFAKKLCLEDNNCFLFDRDNDERHVTFLRKNK
jgi:hypothetical protein